MVEKIVSGGQTGVDQAALLVASELNFDIGGWCPKGGLDENGDCILNKYPNLKEATTANPDERTKLNIRDSDGTLIIVPSWPLSVEIKDGTRLTIQEAKEQGKPYLIINLAAEKDENNFREWIGQNNIRTLNIGGPRESNSKGIYKKTCELFFVLLPQLSTPNTCNGLS